MRRLPTLASDVARVVRRAVASELVPPPLRDGVHRAIQLAKDGLESRRWPQRPQSINVEVTAICDARCIHCPRQAMDRVQRPMPFELFKRLIDQAAELKVPEICPNGFGEVLTMKNLSDYIAYIRSKEHRFRIVVNSNGFRMDEEKIETFLRYEVDLLNITLDGATAETFEKIRVQLKLDQIENNIDRLMQLRRSRNLRYPQVRVGMIAMAQNRHEVPQLLEKWRGRVDHVGVGGFTNRAGSLQGLAIEDAPRQEVKSCVLPFRDLNVWADGRAVLCCDDWNEEHVVGDLTKESLEQIWHGPALTSARNLHLAGRGGEINICGACTMWRPTTPTTRLWS